MRLRQPALIAMIAITPFLPSVARADLVLLLPVNLSGLEPGTRFIGLGCTITDERGGIIGGGGLPFIPITAGRLVTTARIAVRRTERDMGTATEFECFANVYGTRSDGVSYYFMSGRRLRPEGWMGSSWNWRGDAAGSERMSYLPVQKASRPQLIVEGSFTPEQARHLVALEPPPAATECPCGCGAGGPDGAACTTDNGPMAWSRLPSWRDDQQGRRSDPGPTPPPPGKASPTTITPESRRLRLERASPTSTAGSRIVGGSGRVSSGVTLDVGPLVFRGTGRLQPAR